MINLIGILVLLIIEAILVAGIVVYFIYKANISDNEVAERDKELGQRTQDKRQKNLIINKLVKRIEELEYENKELKREIKKIKRTNNKQL